MKRRPVHVEAKRPTPSECKREVSMLKGVIRNGQVIVIGPTDLPDGTEVEILPVGLSAPGDPGQVTPDEIARTLAAMGRIEPFEMTDAERATIEADPS